LIYLDTSVLVAYYCPEPLSDKVEELVTSHAKPGLSHLVEVELFSAVARKVREGQLEKKDAKRILSYFLKHLNEGFYSRHPLNALHYQTARSWIGQLEQPLRTLDALHLALASTEELCLVTADQALARAAENYDINVVLLKP